MDMLRGQKQNLLLLERDNRQAIKEFNISEQFNESKILQQKIHEEQLLSHI